MTREIGSEFWESSPQIGVKEYFLSGRTALEFIIRDILESHSYESVLMPSYCCNTMIEPFVRHGINIRFYDVYCDESEGLSLDLPEYKENEILYYMTYFGFNRINGLEINNLRDKYDVIINDKTHSWLSGKSLIEEDYSYTSFRKWNGFSGIAEASKRDSSFSLLSENDINEEYISKREEAAGWKELFIKGEIDSKDVFLEMFHDAEELLENDYVGYQPSYRALKELITCDWASVKKRRRKNAELLLDGIRGVPEIKLLFKNMDQEDVPLFVPILVRNDRDALRRFLIENHVYCPVHWPLSSLHQNITARTQDIYEHELSLICDQRYDESDMKRIIVLINKYYS